MDEDIIKKNNDLIEDSLEFCADIYEYYEADDINRFKNNYYKKNKQIQRDEAEKVIIVKEQADEEAGFKLYAKIVAVILAAMILARLVNAYLIQETIVNGSSMNPTFESSDKLLIDKLFYKMGALERYDIIVFHYHDSSIYIKRVIGLPGEKITIRKGRVYVNGRILDDDPLINDVMHYSGIAKNGVKLGKDEYFVLGDNRNNSYDSRYEQVGVIKQGSIIGKAWIRIFPISKFGAVN
ncbi:MAG: signal peptidase I [Catonella sp.]|uniref:signal peptidase I n=1 Tax=Catonella sp. TaxID=2382125 RepID=UPI003FA10801